MMNELMKRHYELTMRRIAYLEKIMEEAKKKFEKLQEKQNSQNNRRV